MEMRLFLLIPKPARPILSATELNAKREAELIIEFNEASRVENKHMDDVEKYLQKIGKNHIRIDDLAHFILALK